MTAIEKQTQEVPAISRDGRSEMGAPAAGEAINDYFSTDEIFQRVAASADEEFHLPSRLLRFGGLAAGLSIGLSFYARAAVTGQVESPLIGNLLYPIGFILIVIGRYQLFTENTLTPVTLILTRIASVPMLLRNWANVLLANIVGAAILAYFLANTAVMSDSTREAAIAIGEHALNTPWDALFVKGIMAGWLVASMVWLVHAARDTISRILLVFFIMYLVPTADLYHCIIGICESLYMFFIGQATLAEATLDFFLPVLLGNTVGGVLLVAIINYAQTREARFPERDYSLLELTWKEWLFEFHAGRPQPHEMHPSERHIESELLVPVRDEDYVRGNPDADITIVQYGDYESPDSRILYQIVQRIQNENDDIRYVFRHLPLGSHHPFSKEAACLAEAAGNQGKYWQMHDLLYMNQNRDQLEPADFEQYIEELNLDPEQIERDRQSGEIRQRVERDRREAVKNEIYTALNLFVNGRRFYGPYNREALQKFIMDRQPSLRRQVH